MKGGDEGDVVTRTEGVVGSFLEFPVHLINEDEDAWTETVTVGKEVVTMGDEGIPNPHDEVAQGGDR